MNKSDSLFYAYNVSNNIISYNIPPKIKIGNQFVQFQ